MQNPGSEGKYSSEMKRMTIWLPLEMRLAGTGADPHQRPGSPLSAGSLISTKSYLDRRTEFHSSHCELQHCDVSGVCLGCFPRSVHEHSKACCWTLSSKKLDHHKLSLQLHWWDRLGAACWNAAFISLVYILPEPSLEAPPENLPVNNSL